jgi:hypothetical protein
LKIRVSVVRFRPRPPDNKSLIHNDLVKTATTKVVAVLRCEIHFWQWVWQVARSASQDRVDHRGEVRVLPVQNLVQGDSQVAMGAVPRRIAERVVWALNSIFGSAQVVRRLSWMRLPAGTIQASLQSNGKAFMASPPRDCSRLPDGRSVCCATPLTTALIVLRICPCASAPGYQNRYGDSKKSDWSRF